MHPVSSLDSEGGIFTLTLLSRELKARSVVVATGAFQRAHRPAGAEDLPAGVHQLLAEEYRDPSGLPPGAVLVVGSGQTGCQLAEELQESGRAVYLACGRCAWTPRRIEGRDFVWWSAQSGFLDRPLAALPAPAAR
ncbi:MAG: NAD(P)-binding domain-containing protein, partial [Candidatus Dormiibacterota bacterium]